MEFGFYSSTITSPAVTSVVKQHSLMNNSNVLSFFFWNHFVWHRPRHFPAIITPHRCHHSTVLYVDAAYCYRRSTVLCLSVCLSPSLSWAVRKWLNRSKCRSGCGLGFTQRTMY